MCLDVETVRLVFTGTFPNTKTNWRQEKEDVLGLRGLASSFQLCVTAAYIEPEKSASYAKF